MLVLICLRLRLQITGDEAKKALLAWAEESLRKQERRFIKLKQAFEEAKLDTSGLRKYNLSQATASSVQVAARSSLPLGLLAFLRGPNNQYEQRHMKEWREGAIYTLVQKGACACSVRHRLL